jgi:hypothetical protein
MTLNQLMQTYQQLTNDYQAKKIEKASYSAALIKLKAMDAEGRWWTCTKDGGFLWYDGKRWLPGQPVVSSPDVIPVQQPPLATPYTAGFNQSAGLQKNSPLKGWRKIASTPILSIVPGAMIGGIWFLYTLMQLILGGTGGVDFLTPAILTGVPLLLWLLRKPLDKLTLPLQKLHLSFPFAIRVVIALILPILLGCGCSTISTSGYSAMHFTALISTLVGYFLLHTPTVK